MLYKIIIGSFASDNTISINDFSVGEPDLSSVNSDIWAISWDSEALTGEAEFKSSSPNLVFETEVEFENICGLSLSEVVTLKDARIAEIESGE